MTEPLRGRTHIEVKLQESNTALEEVVVVGYGQQKKESVVGAISQLKADDLLETPSANISQAITGQICLLYTSDAAAYRSRSYHC